MHRSSIVLIGLLFLAGCASKEPADPGAIEPGVIITPPVRYDLLIESPEERRVPKTSRNIPGAARQIVSTGTSANDGTGDPLRTAMQKVNANLADLWATRMATVGTLNELLGVFPSDLQTNVFVAGRTTPNDGFQGIFTYLAGSTLPTNNGTIFRPRVVSGRWVRQIADSTYQSSWFGTNSTAINELLTVGAGNTIKLPSGTIPLNASLFPKSGTKIVGDNTTLVNGATNTPGLILIDILNQRDITLENFTIDSLLGSHYQNGHIWVRGSTNVVARRITSRYPGYLGHFAVVAYNGADSEFCGIEYSTLLDQRYGGSGISISGVGIAEDSRHCFSRYNVYDYPTLGHLNLGWVPVGSGHPNAPQLTVSFDRSYGGEIVGDKYFNTSGMTNLNAVMFEDNTRAPGADNTMRDVLIDGYARGICFAYTDGSFSFDGVKVKNCTTWGIRLHQTEPADYHRVRLLRIMNCDFENNYPAPVGGLDGDEQWINRGGQISFTADPPQRLEIELSRFKSDSADEDFSHILYGGGELVSKRNIFQGGKYGIRATDPIVLSTVPNRMYNAAPEFRKVFLSEGDRFIGVDTPLYGLSSARESEAGIDGVIYEMRDAVKVNVPIDELTTLFSIKTVETESSGIGTSGSYTVQLDGHISNASGASHTIGQVGARDFHAKWTHTVIFDSVNTCTNGLITGWVNPPAQVGSRNFKNVQWSLVNDTYHTTAVKLQLEGEGDVTAASITCNIKITHSGFLRPPQVLK